MGHQQYGGLGLPHFLHNLLAQLLIQRLKRLVQDQQIRAHSQGPGQGRALLHTAGKLIEAAKKTGADYAVDVYPYYGSDVEATLRAGADIRHGLIGAGVYASHGYERSHIDGVYNTIKVLIGYLL